MKKKFSEEVKKYLGKKVWIKVDRPINSLHPRYNFVYEVNYGFVPKTKAPDNEEIDAYILKVKEPVNSYEGICVAIIHRKDDDDDKLIIVPEQYLNISDEEIMDNIFFQEKWFDHVLIR